LTLPLPERGTIIRYAYLWADEHERGQQEGLKDRPALVVALSIRSGEGTAKILAVAITHAPPRDPLDAIPFPVDLSQKLGLGDKPSWIVTAEGNSFTWPGPDVRPISKRRPLTVVYGRVPEALLRRAIASYLQNVRKQKARLVIRSK